jgi:hypothetical protein
MMIAAMLTQGTYYTSKGVFGKVTLQGMLLISEAAQVHLLNHEDLG